MKKILLVSAFALSALPLFGTPVLFSSYSLTGTANNRTILIQPDRVENPLVLGTNLVPLFDFTIQPVAGQVITNLAPWGYTIKVDGWSRSAHIVVPDDTNTLNAAVLINTNAFAPLTIYTGEINVSGGGGGDGSHATNADYAITANTATNAAYATNSGMAALADYATTAGSANYSTAAGAAEYATSAGEAALSDTGTNQVNALALAQAQAVAVLTNEPRAVLLSNPLSQYAGTVSNDFQPYLLGNAMTAARNFPIDRIITRGFYTYLWSAGSNYITDENLVLTIMTYCQTSPLYASGWRTITLCDGWWNGRNQSTGMLQENTTNFPHGLAWLCNKAWTNGFTIRLYYDDKPVGGWPGPGPFQPAFDAGDLGIITSQMVSNDCVYFRNLPHLGGIEWDNRRPGSGTARYNIKLWSDMMNKICPNLTFGSYGSSEPEADWLVTTPAGVAITNDPYTDLPVCVTNLWNGIDNYVNAHKLPQWRANCSDYTMYIADQTSFPDYVFWQWSAAPLWTGGRPVFAMTKFDTDAIVVDFGDTTRASARAQWAFTAGNHGYFDCSGAGPFLVGINPYATNEFLEAVQRDPALRPLQLISIDPVKTNVSWWAETLANGSKFLVCWNKGTNSSGWVNPSLNLGLLSIHSPVLVTEVFEKTNFYLAANLTCQLTNNSLVAGDARAWIITSSNANYVYNGQSGVGFNGQSAPYQLGTVGSYAHGEGYQPTPSGNYSFVGGGRANTSSGSDSFSANYVNVASGHSASAFGQNNTASGTAAFVAGNGNTAANYDTVFGLNATTTGQGTFFFNGGAYGSITEAGNFVFRVAGCSGGSWFSDRTTVANDLNVSSNLTAQTLGGIPLTQQWGPGLDVFMFSSLFNNQSYFSTFNYNLVYGCNASGSFGNLYLHLNPQLLTFKTNIVTSCTFVATNNATTSFTVTPIFFLTYSNTCSQVNMTTLSFTNFSSSTPAAPNVRTVSWTNSFTPATLNTNWNVLTYSPSITAGSGSALLILGGTVTFQ